jgi:hypothetical protein
MSVLIVDFTGSGALVAPVAGVWAKADPGVKTIATIAEDLTSLWNFLSVVTGASIASAVQLSPERPDLLDHREQKGGSQPEQHHAVQCLECSHHLPMRIKKYIPVAVGSDRAEGVEHSRAVVRQRAEDPIGCRSNGSLERKQYSYH